MDCTDLQRFSCLEILEWCPKKRGERERVSEDSARRNKVCCLLLKEVLMTNQQGGRWFDEDDDEGFPKGQQNHWWKKNALVNKLTNVQRSSQDCVCEGDAAVLSFILRGGATISLRCVCVCYFECVFNCPGVWFAWWLLVVFSRWSLSLSLICIVFCLFSCRGGLIAVFCFHVTFLFFQSSSNWEKCYDFCFHVYALFVLSQKSTSIVTNGSTNNLKESERDW